jgi:Cu/Ag efflux protein CusF
MKTKKSGKWTGAALSLLMAGTTLNTLADQSTATGRNEKSYTGMIVSVDPAEQRLKVKGMLFSKGFHLGSSCTYELQERTGVLSDLHPGQKVTVCYQKADGVLVADRVAQQPLRLEGVVRGIDPQNHALTVRHRGMETVFQTPADCRIALRDDKTGSLNDVQVGNRVTVTYEGPRNGLVARKIAQESRTFTGALTAMDLNDHTLKAKALTSAREFSVADHCAIMLNGKPAAGLDDLKLGQRFVFDYYDVNGVSIVTRIANVEETSKGLTAAERGNLMFP